MTTTEQTTQNQFTLPYIKIMLNGSALSSDIVNELILVEVQQSLHLPSMFTLRLFDPDMKWYGLDSFAIGSEIEIKMGQSEASLSSIFKGEIGGLELDHGEDFVPVVTVRGYDKLYRMHLGRKTRTFLQVKDSDLVSKLAGEAGLRANAVDTSTVYDYIIQNNETNLEFLQRRMFRIGKELFVENGTTLKLRDRATAASTITVTWGVNLIRFSSRLSVANQVSEVTVRGWDVKTKAAIVGQASSSDNHPSVGESRTGDAIASSGLSASGSKITSTNWPVLNQTEATQIAKAVYDDLSGRFIQIEGTTIGDPNIKPGVKIKLAKIGAKFSGDYYLTSCTHRYNARGYETDFESNGRQNNTIYELTGHSAQQTDRIYGVVVGLVTNVKPPTDGIAQVKVAFPWMAQNAGKDIESDWARLVTPMAGNGRGFFFLPEVNDEVLVAFEHGDVTRPYVVGALWNGKDAQPQASSATVGSDGKIKERMLKTTSGHTLTFNDSDDAPKVTIIDKTGNNKITVDSASNTITIESDADLMLKATKGKITMDAKEVEIKGSTNVTVKATQNVNVEATQNLTLDAKQNVKVSATVNAEINGTAAAKMSGTQVEVNGTASGKINGGAMLEVKGGILKLN